jgi:transcriptional regulator with XRE-family HTH domain
VKSEELQAFNRKLGEVFKSEREKQKLSRNRLSEVAGVSRTGIILFERGERAPTTVICAALAAGLGVPLSTLVKRAEKALSEP